MKLIFLIIAVVFLTNQKEEDIPVIKYSNIESSEAKFFLSKDKEEACDTAELTEEKIVEQAMKPAKVNESGALQGATDCVVE